jgi:hypothetical protein
MYELCVDCRYVRNELGLQGELVCYATSSLTPENVLLLAWHDEAEAPAQMKEASRQE